MNFYKLTILLILTSLIACKPTSTTTSSASSSFSKSIDSARNVNYMTKREKDMVKEINLIRSNPKAYVQVVENYISEVEERKKTVISGKQYLNQEIKTAKELIEELKKTKPMQILAPHKDVYEAAEEHGVWMKRKGKFDHKGSKGSYPWDRVLAKNKDLTDAGENLVGGPENVRESVLLLLVDSGIKNRGHRKALLDPTWKYVACYEVGKVKDLPNSWVQNFAK